MAGPAYRLLVGKPEGRKALGRPRRRWLTNIRMALVENLRVPYNAWKLSSVQTTRDLSSSAQLHGVSNFNIIYTTSYYK
jgi:hypothetical protein